MIEFREGDIFKSNCDALVNPVNCVGTMGKGLAAAFKKQFPSNFGHYAQLCRGSRMRVGEVYPFQDRLYKSGFTVPVWVINLPTKMSWRNPSEIRWIIEGLDALKEWAETAPVKTIAVPALGCGLGELDWHEVKQVMIDNLSQVPNVTFVVFEPFPADR